MKTNKEIVKLLLSANRAKSNETHPGSILSSVTPVGFKVSLDSHSTADHCEIYLTIEGEPDLLIWYKTNWCSSNYEFNEEGKTQGLQKGCEFIGTKVGVFFNALDREMERVYQENRDNLANKEEKEMEKKQGILDKYRAAYP